MIYNIAVISEFRGTGVGETMFKEAHERLKEFGAIHFTALVHTGNGGGRWFWRKLDSEEKLSWCGLRGGTGNHKLVISSGISSTLSHFSTTYSSILPKNVGSQTLTFRLFSILSQRKHDR
jgi:hypothetical protein